MKEVVEMLAKVPVNYADQVKVTELAGRDATIIELRTAKEDMGKIIGKGGQNVQAIRTILNPASRKLDKRVFFEIVDA